MRIALDQLAAEIGFQPADMLADRRLPKPQPLRRQRKARHLLDGEKTAKLHQIEHRLILKCDNRYFLHSIS